MKELMMLLGVIGMLWTSGTARGNEAMERDLGLKAPASGVKTMRMQTTRTGVVMSGGKQVDKAVKVYKDSQATVPVFFEVGRVMFEKRDAVNNELALMDLAKVMKKYPNMHFVIEGHTCDIGAEGDNVKISWQRAEAVKGRMIQLGVDPTRLVTLGFGEREAPTHFDEKDRSAATEEARKAYRRVVVRQLAR